MNAQKRDTIVAFDADGTILDSLREIYQTDVQVFIERGLPIPTVNQYRRAHAEPTHMGSYKRLGVNEEDVSAVIERFYELYRPTTNPELVPWAKEVIESAWNNLGMDGVHIITNRRADECERIFHKVGLDRLIDRLHTPEDDKSEELHKLCSRAGRVMYVGDIPADLAACIKARNKMSEPNLVFLGMAHRYALCHEDELRASIAPHSKYATALSSIQHVRRVWNGRRH